MGHCSGRRCRDRNLRNIGISPPQGRYADPREPRKPAHAGPPARPQRPSRDRAVLPVAVAGRAVGRAVGPVGRGTGTRRACDLASCGPVARASASSIGRARTVGRGVTLLLLGERGSGPTNMSSSLMPQPTRSAGARGSARHRAARHVRRPCAVTRADNAPMIAPGTARARPTARPRRRAARAIRPPRFLVFSQDPPM
jgi:hypothetical protein